jgi:spore germination protein KB
MSATKQQEEQIGAWNLAALMVGFLLGSSVVLPMAVQARQDAWLSILLGGVAGLVAGWVYTSLSLRFPRQSLIGYSKTLLGSWLGGAVGLLYIWYALHLGALVLRNFGEFLVTTILSITPLSVIILTLTLLCVHAVRHGLEVLSRTALLLTAGVTAFLLASMALELREAHLQNLLPLMEQGPIPILQGALSTFSFPFAETVLFAMILPSVSPVHKRTRTALLSLGTGCLLLILIHGITIAVIGAHLVETSRFPGLAVIKYIDIADFLTRLEAIMVTTLSLTGFMKVAVCLYVAVRGLAEWAGLEDYRPLVLPMGALQAALSILAYHNVTEMSSFAATIWPVYSIPFQVLIPAVLWVVARVRQAYSA